MIALMSVSILQAQDLSTGVPKFNKTTTAEDRGLEFLKKECPDVPADSVLFLYVSLHKAIHEKIDSFQGYASFCSSDYADWYSEKLKDLRFDANEEVYQEMYGKSIDKELKASGFARSAKKLDQVKKS